MTRKRCNRQIRPASAPMLVSRTETIETSELMIVEAFAGGWATTWHFDALVDMRNAMTIAQAYRADESAKTICEAMRAPLAAMRERYAKTKRMGVTGDELQLLRVFVDYYRDFWLRRPLALYQAVCNEVGDFNMGEKERNVA